MVLRFEFDPIAYRVVYVMCHLGTNRWRTAQLTGQDADLSALAIAQHEGAVDAASLVADVDVPAPSSDSKIHRT
ncbi:MAG: hypothetical protein ACR2K2_02755 [Mycobacteriales bacterium]